MLLTISYHEYPANLLMSSGDLVILLFLILHNIRVSNLLYLTVPYTALFQGVSGLQSTGITEDTHFSVFSNSIPPLVIYIALVPSSAFLTHIGTDRIPSFAIYSCNQ